MNLRAVTFVLGNLLLIAGMCMLAPLSVAVCMSSDSPYEAKDTMAFVWPIIISLLVGTSLRFGFRRHAEGVELREGFAVVSLSWVILSFLGMLPFLISGVTENVADAYFETMSGLTTTGATIFSDIESLPPGVQFWRHMTQWLGGMGIVVLSVALLPILGSGGYRMLKAETPGGVAYERDRPRITDSAKDLWRLYLGFSIVLMLLLWALGMPLYDAICHAFTTMSTGGFSTQNASVGAYGPMIQWVIIVFMLVGGTSFSLHAFWLRREFKVLFKNTEWRVFIGIVLGVTLIGFLTCEHLLGPEARLRTVMFQVVAVLTTTGYATADFDTWPHAMRLAMVCLMFIGGSMGSTSGGMKVARWIVYFKAPLRELYRSIYPHAVQPLRLGERVLDSNIISNILAFAMIFFVLVALGGFVLAGYGYDLSSALSASVSALGNVGPGLGEFGPTRNWGHMPGPAKWLMSFLMLAGRLEVFTILVLFTPWVWRR